MKAPGMKLRRSTRESWHSAQPSSASRTLKITSPVPCTPPPSWPLSQTINAETRAPAKPPAMAFLRLPTPPPADQRLPHHDPDGDGVPNLLEYALAGDPASSASAPAPLLQVSGLSPQPSFLTLRFTRHRADLDYTVEASSTLASDSWSVIATNPGLLGAEATVQDPVPLTPESPRRFLRLRVSER